MTVYRHSHLLGYLALPEHAQDNIYTEQNISTSDLEWFLP